MKLVRSEDVDARVADEVATWEVGTVPPEGATAEAVEAVVVGTVIFEAVLVGLRRLAHEHHSAQRFTGQEPNRQSLS